MSLTEYRVRRTHRSIHNIHETRHILSGNLYTSKCVWVSDCVDELKWNIYLNWFLKRIVQYAMYSECTQKVQQISICNCIIGVLWITPAPFSGELACLLFSLAPPLSLFLSSILLCEFVLCTIITYCYPMLFAWKECEMNYIAIFERYCSTPCKCLVKYDCFRTNCSSFPSSSVHFPQ